MNLRLFKILIKKTKKYDKKATNPFLEANFEDNPFKNIYEQTYIWVTKERG
ncbi:MAG: hypothetical protein IKL52_04630 [Candidatus Gastranaerophilales bacterium]|jgi:hypothetical protein|nr:hypothetical protein [Candidatus Gastranaerophilales bacterium]